MCILQYAQVYKSNQNKINTIIWKTLRDITVNSNIVAEAYWWILYDISVEGLKAIEEEDGKDVRWGRYPQKHL